VSLLARHKVTLIVDVRTIPRSRHNPQFNRETLPGELTAHKIGYEHVRELGGLRKPRADSRNTAWQNASFRGFADYMETDDFGRGLEHLEVLSRAAPTAVMCAESLPWRCHRSLIADALSASGFSVIHIMADGAVHHHTITPFARIEAGHVTYPG
jgi:uncharacterized protein (DUF488 family)